MFEDYFIQGWIQKEQTMRLKNLLFRKLMKPRLSFNGLKCFTKFHLSVKWRQQLFKPSKVLQKIICAYCGFRTTKAI